MNGSSAFWVGSFLNQTEMPGCLSPLAARHPASLQPGSRPFFAMIDPVLLQPPGLTPKNASAGSANSQSKQNSLIDPNLVI